MPLMLLTCHHLWQNFHFFGTYGLQGSVTLLIVGFYVPKINILSELNKSVSEKIFQNSHESING